MNLPFFKLPNVPEPSPEDALGLGRSRRPSRYRAIWISDVHLGIPECRADVLYDFLKHTESEYLYLVGDIVDCWKLRKGWYWPQIYNNLIRVVLGKAKYGTHVVYIPGNHDEVFREYTGSAFGDIQLRREATHITADGRRFLVMHGDEFDSVVRHSAWVAHLGSVAYELLLKVNRWLNAVRRRMGFSYWSLSAYLKHRVKKAVQFMDHFEESVSREATRRRVDGLICGHIHKATMSSFGDVTYCNDGDWVESCTALVENLDGSLELINWLDVVAGRELEKPHATGHRVGRLATAD